MSASTRADARTRRSWWPRRRTILVVTGVIGLAVLALALYFLAEAARARSAFSEVDQQARTLRQQITSGDNKSATATLRDLQSSTTRARENTDGPLWAAAAFIPVIGDDIDAVRTVAASLDEIAHQGVPPVVDTSTSLDADLFRPKDGRFDLKAFRSLAPSVTTAAQVLTDNRRKLDDIDTGSLIGRLRGPVADLKRTVATTESAASTAAQALRLAPQMLGGEGNRTYLVLFQNNAEARATGGIPGAFAILRASNGRVRMNVKSSVSDVGAFKKPVLPLTKGELATYGTILGNTFADTNLTPHFPRTAELTRKMVKRRLGIAVDGVMSVDPVALSYVLEGTGPVKAPGRTTLTAGNAVDVLLNTVYARYRNPEGQNAFIAESALRVFDAMLSGAGSSRGILEGLARGVDERRVLLWAARDREQDELADTEISGRLVGKADAPHVGVYLSDSVASKMQYYLRYNTKVAAQACTDSGAQELRSITTLRSTAPEDAKLLPRYIAGSGQRSPLGSQRVNVRVFAPYRGTIEKLEVNGKAAIFAGSEDRGRPVLLYSVLLKPGEKVKLAVTMTSGPGQRENGVLSTTPGVEPVENGVPFPTGCD